jgi:hypothetical protein
MTLGSTLPLIEMSTSIKFCVNLSPDNDSTSVRGRKHESKLTETEEGETGEKQSQEHAYHFR